MQLVWTRKNQPLLLSLVNQLLMVGADVDNDLFRCGENVDKSDGDAVANLTYRVTALYTGRDPVLVVRGVAPREPLLAAATTVPSAAPTVAPVVP